LTNIAEKAIVSLVNSQGFYGSWFSKKFPSYVKIVTICCTNPFYTQLTCVHRKKNKDRKLTKSCKKVCVEKCSIKGLIVKIHICHFPLLLLMLLNAMLSWIVVIVLKFLIRLIVFQKTGDLRQEAICQLGKFALNGRAEDSLD